jgi:hypothetical protein
MNLFNVTIDKFHSYCDVIISLIIIGLRREWMHGCLLPSDPSKLSTQIEVITIDVCELLEAILDFSV